MKKLAFQIAVILYVVAFFLVADVFLYTKFVKRLQNPFSEEMRAKSIELSEFLPFEEHSRIVKVRAEESERFSEGEELPVLDGATALFPVYSAIFNALYPESASQFDGKSFSEESKLQKRNTAGAFKAIVGKSADIVFCADPSKKQLQFAKENGVELKLIPIGYEAFVFLVNKSNPVDSLTVSEIKAIYSGKIGNWSEVGGENSKISALLRPEGSGSQTAMLALMGDEKISPKYGNFAGRTLGYSFRYYVNGIVADKNLKLLALNGIFPNKENIRTKRYPIVGNFYAICRAEDFEKEPIQKVIRFALSEQGQRIVEESGYVGL